MATLVSRIEAHVSAYAAQVLAEAKAADAMGHKRCVKCGEAIPLTEVALWDLSGDEQHRHMHCLPADLRDAIGPIKKDEP